MAINVSTGLNAWVPGNNVQPDTVEPDIAVRAPVFRARASLVSFNSSFCYLQIQKLCLAQFALILRHSGHVRCEELDVLLSEGLSGGKCESGLLQGDAQLCRAYQF